MTRIYILCEGLTEEQFVRKIIAPHLLSRGVFATAIGLEGGFNYDRLKFNIHKTLNNDKDAFVSTFIDFYGLRGDYPGDAIKGKSVPPDQKVGTMEEAILIDIKTSPNLHNIKFIPYFQLHEFESLLFSDPEILEVGLSIDQKLPKDCFVKIRRQFNSPEHINDSPQTAPSKRLKEIAPFYDKVADGPTLIEIMGLEKIRQECPLFNHWLEKLENLKGV
jgi:hypothetical protein